MDLLDLRYCNWKFRNPDPPKKGFGVPQAGLDPFLCSISSYLPTGIVEHAAGIIFSSGSANPPALHKATYLP